LLGTLRCGMLPLDLLCAIPHLYLNILCATLKIISGVRCNAVQSRSGFVATVASTAAAVIWGGVATPSANAAKYGSFGVGSSEVINPVDAEIDRSVLASKEVQDALARIRKYKDVVAKMQSAVATDPQFNVRPIILKELDAAPLRSSLNTVNMVFEEDTQRGTDRLIRVILQDITELEVANAQKEGIPRSPRRLENVQAKLSKLEQAFDDYLAFTK
jgi:hypothetical protein